MVCGHKESGKERTIDRWLAFSRPEKPNSTPEIHGFVFHAEFMNSFPFFLFFFFASRKFMDLAAVYIYPRIYLHGRTGTAGMLNINVFSYKSRLRLDAPRRVEIYRFSNEFSRSNERPRCCFLTEGRFIFRMEVLGTTVILINSGELKIIRSRQVLLNTFEIMNF